MGALWPLLKPCLLLCALPLFVACKGAADRKAKPCQGEACLSHYQKQEKDGCAKIIGARWDDRDGVCRHPASEAECRQISSKYSFDGAMCVNNATPKNYYRWCNDRSAPEAIAKTVRAIADLYRDSNCGAIFEALRHSKSLILQSADLTNLRPLALLHNLEKLDLWNNEIKDLSALSGLTKLRELNLGHNAIDDVSPLRSLVKLERLYLFENKIIDPEPLSRLTRLKLLDLRRNHIADFSSIEAMGIKTLQTSGNRQKAPSP